MQKVIKIIFIGWIIILALQGLGSAQNSRIKILEPPDKLLTQKEYLFIQGKALSLSELRINGELVDVEKDGSFSVGLILHPGKNLVEVSGIDINGERTVERRKILRIVSFPDIEILYQGMKHWARKEIIHLSTLEIIEGYPDSYFYPQSKVLRGELATWLARANNLSLPSLKEDVFFDVPKEHWRAAYIKAVVDQGYMKGYYGKDLFGLEDDLTRAKAAQIITRVQELEVPKEIVHSPFRDVAPAHSGAREILAAFKHGFLIGLSKKKLYRFEPYREMTRAEAAVMIARIGEVKMRIRELFIWEEGYDYTRLCKVNTPPYILEVEASPQRVPADAKTLTKLTVTVGDKQGLEDIFRVVINLSAIGGPPDALMEDSGRHGDKEAGDGIYTLILPIAKEVSPGIKNLSLEVTDRSGWKDQDQITLTIIKE